VGRRNRSSRSRKHHAEKINAGQITTPHVGYGAGPNTKPCKPTIGPKWACVVSNLRTRRNLACLKAGASRREITHECLGRACKAPTTQASRGAIRRCGRGRDGELATHAKSVWWPKANSAPLLSEAIRPSPIRFQCPWTS
jgi:hypothetical protein